MQLGYKSSKLLEQLTDTLALLNESEHAKKFRIFAGSEHCKMREETNRSNILIHLLNLDSFVFRTHR